MLQLLKTTLWLAIATTPWFPILICRLLEKIFTIASNDSTFVDIRQIS
ncbi:MAG: hypothetical protein WHV26_12155 [Spirochaetota bacterium]